MSISNRTPLLHSTRIYDRQGVGYVSMGTEQPADLTVELGAQYAATAAPLTGNVRSHDGCSIYYELHGLLDGSLDNTQHLPKVVMIMGLACGCSGWRWQLQDLVQQHKMIPDSSLTVQQTGVQQQQQQRVPQSALAAAVEAAQQQLQQRMIVCIIDNRGVGNSSSPADMAAYSTQHMGQDVLSVMDHLNWQQAHILGFSMGGMIAQRLAATAPERVSSLTLLSTSAGGWQIVPMSWSGLRTAFKMVTARTAEDAVDATLHMHFRRRTLKAWVSHMSARRQELLRREYMTPNGGAPPQPPHGFKGQLMACWRHRLSNSEAQTIRAAGFPVLVLHGRNDKLASAANAEKLATRLGAPCVILPGAHFIVRECAGQINMLLSSLVFGKQHFISVPNAPYMDPSPSILKLWKANLGQQMIANGKCSATGPVGLPSSMPPAVTLQAVAPSAAVGGYGGSNAGVGVVVDAASMVERKGSNGAREKHH